LWIKFTATGTHAVLDYGQAGNTAGYATDAVDVGGGAVGFQIALSDGSRANYPFINTTHHNFNDGNWHLLVVTCSRSGNMMAYVDNVIEGSVSTSTAPGSVNSTNGFALGANYAGGILFDGSLDEFGLWNRVLTSTEITHLWNGGAGTTYPFTGL
jgi:hypothetical protein